MKPATTSPAVLPDLLAVTTAQAPGAAPAVAKRTRPGAPARPNRIERALATEPRREMTEDEAFAGFDGRDDGDSLTALRRTP